MSSKSEIEKIKQLREITGVGFKDCKTAIDETQGDIDKAIDFLRKKGISKANKKMERVAADGLVSVFEKDSNYVMVEINSETDFVAKNKEFITFVKEVSEICFDNKGDMEKTLKSNMKNKKTINENLVDLISKIGEKITFRRCAYIDNKESYNFSYIHSPLEKNIGKIGVLLKIKSTSKIDIKDLGHKLTMHIAAMNPLSIDVNDLDSSLVEKERSIIEEEVKNTGKPEMVVKKIADGKLKKFVEEKSLLNQVWILDTKKKVRDVLKEYFGNEKFTIVEMKRFKVGEGI